MPALRADRAAATASNAMRWVDLAELAQQRRAVLDPAELAREVLQRRRVQVGADERHGVAHERRSEAVVERLPRGLLDADLCHRAGDDDRLDAERAQHR